MNHTRQVCENALLRLQSASKAQLEVVQHYFARRDLEANLAALLDAARGHEAHSVPAGSPQYLVLYEQSEHLITGYCERWQVAPDQLNAGAAGILHLTRANQDPERVAFLGFSCPRPRERRQVLWGFSLHWRRV